MPPGATAIARATPSEATNDAFAPTQSPTDSTVAPRSPRPVQSLDPEAAALAELLPTKLGSVDYAAVGGTGPLGAGSGVDNCTLICGSDVLDYARRLGFAAGTVTEVFDVPVNWLSGNWTPTDVAWILAVRVPGADDDKLVTSWVQRDVPGLPVRSWTIGSKKAAFDPGGGPSRGSFAYASADILFVVFADIPVDESLMPTSTPPEVVEAFNALP